MKPTIQIKEFNYSLPESRIAKYPLPDRDASKLLIYKKQCISEARFTSLEDYLNQQNLLVFNNSKVIRARIPFFKPSGAEIEIFCLEPANGLDTQLAFTQKCESEWKCIVGNLKRWKSGLLTKSIIIRDQPVILRAEKINSSGDAHHIRFSWDQPELCFGEILEMAGETPIPPYLNRESEAIDKERYQTVYSIRHGSVAAPTAGLHFTPELIDRLEKKGLATTQITLHVGAGTFKPVKSETIDAHEMHNEHFNVTKETLLKLIHHCDSIVSVGTTTTRTLESLYWLGIKADNGDDSMHLGQWEAYSLTPKFTYAESLKRLLNFMEEKQLEEISASTAILIAPGYQFKAIDALLTNFHQPQSTLLLLLAAWVGEDWKKIYNYALEHQFRFLSYGDSSLLFAKDR